MRFRLGATQKPNTASKSIPYPCYTVTMSTIKAILEADADGTLHLPLPPEFLRGPLAVVATIEPIIQEAHEHEAKRQTELLAMTERIRERDPF